MISLVAVHGNGGGGFRFSRMHDHLPEDVSLEAVTLPGFGGRPADPALRTLSDFAEALWDEIDHLPRPLVLLGHGIGGSIALDLVQRHPVDGLVLHAPVGTRLDSRWFPRVMRPEPVRRLVRWGIASRVTRPVLRRRWFSPEVPAEYADRFLAEYGKAESFGQMFDVINASWWDRLEPVDLPAVLLWGAGDRVLGADQVEDYLRLLPDAVVDVVPGWGHFPMADHPAPYTGKVVDWARRLAGGMHREAPVTIGSGGVSALGAGPKAALLDRAAAAGLPVPSSAVLPEGMPLRGPVEHLGARVAVRSAFSGEDAEGSLTAGKYTSVLRVDASDPVALEAAVAEVRASAGPEIRRDVLLMRMVGAVRSGVAFTESEFEDDLVDWTTGTAEDLLGGRERGGRLDVPKLRAGESPDSGDAAWKQRLQALLRDVRSEFGSGEWDVEWADDGHTCWLIQLRPIGSPVRRDEVFTVANHREILPDPPSVFMTSVIDESADQLFDYYRRFDARLPQRRRFIEVFDGRPLINLSLMLDLMRHLGLPPSLVTDSIGGSAVGGRAVNPLRVLRNLPVLARMFWAQVRAVGYSRAMARRISRLTSAPPASLSEAVARMERLYVMTVDGMTALNTASAAPVALLRAAGTLEEHAAGADTAATRMFRALDEVRRSLTDEDHDALAGGRPPVSATGAEAWDRWLADYGHRGIFESDLARPRYAEDPSPILAALSADLPPRRLPPRTLRGAVTRPVWWFAARPVRAREWFRSEAMRGFASMRRDLLRLAGEAGLADPGDLWDLEVAEVRRLDEGWLPDPGLLETRRKEQAARSERPLPELVRRFDDLAVLTGSVTPAGRLGGISLTTGTVEGRAWVLREPSVALPDGFDPATTVLVAASVDAGWLATFGRVAGVAVETGGDLSHGSVILRELGLPAVTNVSGLLGGIATGDRVRLEASSGVVVRLDIET